MEIHRLIRLQYFLLNLNNNDNINYMGNFFVSDKGISTTVSIKNY